MKSSICIFLILACSFAATATESADSPQKGNSNVPFLEAEILFPPETIHNHSSSIVECADGSLLVCWYHGSGERTANDVAVLGARKPRNQKTWSRPFILADTPGYPDTNPILFIDPQKRLWLVYSTVLNNQWYSALLKYKISTDYLKAGPPKWQDGDMIHLTPDVDFSSEVEKAVAALAQSVSSEKIKAELEGIRQRAGDKLLQRLGWMPRVHMLVVNARKWILPLYSDGFDFSIMAITSDAGATWQAGKPMIGQANVQPSLVRKKITPRKVRPSNISDSMRPGFGKVNRPLHLKGRPEFAEWNIMVFAI